MYIHLNDFRLHTIFCSSKNTKIKMRAYFFYGHSRAPLEIYDQVQSLVLHKALEHLYQRLRAVNARLTKPQRHSLFYGTHFSLENHNPQCLLLTTCIESCSCKAIRTRNPLLNPLAAYKITYRTIYLSILCLAGRENINTSLSNRVLINVGGRTVAPPECINGRLLEALRN